MKVLVFNQQRDLTIAQPLVKLIVKEILALEKRSTDEVAVYFVSTKKICRLHEDFFQDPTPTDCISFPLDETGPSEDYHVLGEVFICPKTAVNYVLKKGKEELGEVYRETTLYLVHGILHLLGYDDIEKKDRSLMRALEKKYMGHLARKDLLLIGRKPQNTLKST